MNLPEALPRIGASSARQTSLPSRSMISRWYRSRGGKPLSPARAEEACARGQWLRESGPRVDSSATARGAMVSCRV